MSNEAIAEALIALGRSKGNKPHDVRDAAHEAFHAMTAGVDDWDRENIHEALVALFDRRGGNADFWLHEMEARAVEQIVCERLGVPTKAIEAWYHTSVLEAMKGALPYHCGDGDPTLAYARKRLTHPATLAAAERIIDAAKAYGGIA